jgi:hypothetical protein
MTAFTDRVRSLLKDCAASKLYCDLVPTALAETFDRSYLVRGPDQAENARQPIRQS